MDKQLRYTQEYNFKRMAVEGESCWEDIIKRFIKEMVKRGCKTPQEDLEWLCLNYYCLPNSPALKSAGEDKFFASACSSYPIMDSMDEGEFSILNSLKISSMATKRGIGTGFNFSNLRSKEEPVHGKPNTTGGPVSFLKAINGFIKEITQASRKSASMGTLSVHHPDILDFITCKSKDGTIENFNLSVLLSDEFMDAVEKDSFYTLPYITKFGCDCKIWNKELKAKEVFDAIALNTWNNGEPGLIFTGNIKKDYFIDIDDRHILNNPCQEAILSYSEQEGNEWLEMCVLASLNLPKYVELSATEKERVINITVNMLNDIIDLQDYVTPLQKKGMQDINRKIGIGVAGLATVLAKRAIKYSSEAAYEYTKKLFYEIGSMATHSSHLLGNCASVHTRRNASLISVAPTSSLGNIFNDINVEGCSYGIEPYFTLDTHTVNNSFGSFEKKEKIIDFLGEEKAKEIIECANDLNYKSHIKIIQAIMEANWGKGIMQSVSKTINFKNNVTVDEVKEAIIYCWKNKVKGISFYRDGSRKNQVIQTKESYGKDCVELDAKGRPVDLFVHQSPKRPAELDCDIYHVQSESKRWLVLVGLFNGKPYEVFAGDEDMISIPKKHKTGKIKKNGGYHLVVGEGDDELIIKDIPAAFKNPQYASLTRIISFSLRHGGPLKFAVEQLLKEGGFDAINKAIARQLKRYIKDEESAKEKCPTCGGNMRYISGCPVCQSCNYTKCG